LRWGWWFLAAIACGLGVLTKGPIAAILLTPPIWAYRRLTGKSCPIGWRAVAAFTALTLVVVLPWYLAICVRRPDFASYFLLQHNLMRFLSPFDHLQPIWFYGPVLLLGLLPATLLLVPFLRFLMSGETSVVSRRSPELGFVLLAGGWCLLFFSLSGSKLPTYIMPAFPPLCLALGYYLAGSRWMATRWPRTVAALAFAIVCLGHNLVLPWYAGYRAPLGRVAEFAEYCGDPATPIIFYPRNCDSIAFHLQRDDLRTFRSKETNVLVEFLRQRPRTVIVFTHRHSLDALRHAFTPDLELVQIKHGTGAHPRIVECPHGQGLEPHGRDLTWPLRCCRRSAQADEARQARVEILERAASHLAALTGTSLRCQAENRWSLPSSSRYTEALFAPNSAVFRLSTRRLPDP
jgi:hypothetical protein